MRWQAYADRGVLLSGLEPNLRLRLIERLESSLPTNCEEYVIGYDSLLLIGPVEDLLIEIGELASEVERPPAEEARSEMAPITEIPVVYNGCDLESVARSCQLSVAELVKLHSDPVYTVHMMGFAPGFPYLEGLPPRLHLDRRKSPRNQIPPGTVAIGGSHAGIYPVASPGGWHLLGQTDVVLFKPEAAKAANLKPSTVFTLKPGDRIRFKAIDRAS